MNQVRPYGSRAALVAPRPPAGPLDLAAAITAARRPDIVEVVPAAETVLVIAASAGDSADLRAWLAGLEPLAAVRRPAGGALELDVLYDGDDLADVAEATGLTPAEVIERHAGAEYRCEFCGFAPGFGYLSGLDPVLELPRRTTPRTRVPAGSVAIAGPYSAAYPRPSPGGWHLLGRTNAALWDPDREPAALIAPGTVVRFRRVERLEATNVRDIDERPAGADSVEIVAPGWSTTVQDAGRRGLAHVGVSPSGALDGRKRALVNRLVGNPETAAVVETAGGLVIEAIRPLVVADSTTASVRTLQPGETATVDPAPEESWAYLAVRGGIEVKAVLGSRSRDQLAGLGPPSPTAGTRYVIGTDPLTPIAIDQAPTASRRTSEVTIRLGPRHDWFTDEALGALEKGRWAVSADRSRVGVRLTGPTLARRDESADRELPSEGLVTGAIQVPSGGQPIVMLADHPTTGGYPVIAVVDVADLAAVAQRPPGERLRFRIA